MIGAELKEAKVTAVVNEVNLLPTAAAPRKAAVNDDVRRGTAVRTGGESRSELTFTDQTIARLGANTLFSFEEGTRKMELGGGAMLLRVPKDAGGAKIRTAAVTAAITGTTVMMQYDAKGYAKFVVLEGDCLSVSDRQSGRLRAGESRPAPQRKSESATEVSAGAGGRRSEKTDRNIQAALFGFRTAPEFGFDHASDAGAGAVTLGRCFRKPKHKSNRTDRAGGAGPGDRGG